ncbi:hypothetical protein [Halioxenophilus aromaticivorans]|uniref:Thiamine biosynthesis protein ThiS n=1 Tax=Halioxenophilus aromaticivorans TaxID=1306992 RepID=A0AAV3U5I6_9ALTE
MELQNQVMIDIIRSPNIKKSVNIKPGATVREILAEANIEVATYESVMVDGVKVPETDFDKTRVETGKFISHLALKDKLLHQSLRM